MRLTNIQRLRSLIQPNCRNTSDLYKALDKCKVGDTLDLELLREHGEQAKEHVKVTLEEG